MKLKIMIKNFALKVIRFWLWTFDKKVLYYINADCIPHFRIDRYVALKALYIYSKNGIIKAIYETCERDLEAIVNTNPTA